MTTNVQSRRRAVHHRDGQHHTDLRALANLIEALFGPLRTFVIAGSDHPNAADARIRGERRRRRGQPAAQAA